MSLLKTVILAFFLKTLFSVKAHTSKYFLKLCNKRIKMNI